MNNCKRQIIIFLFVLLGPAVFTGCMTTSPEPLSSWNDRAPARNALVKYVNAVTKKGSADYIPVERRIAVFDFDGTLFLETDPTYFDWCLFEHRVLEDTAYSATAVQKAAAKASREGKIPPLSISRERMVAEAYRGLTLKEFVLYVRKFMAEQQPGFIGLKRGDAFYLPMLEIVDYLRNNGFTVYVISGTDRLMVRTLAEVLRLPPHQIIGSDSSIVADKQGKRDALDYVYGREDTLKLGGRNQVKCLQMNKISAIVKEIGYQPVLAFGNAMSDASMLNYTISGNRYRALGFMLLCDDLEREYGNLKKAGQMLESCRRYGWIPVSMRNDWKTIYGKGVKLRKKAIRKNLQKQ